MQIKTIIRRQIPALALSLALVLMSFGDMSLSLASEVYAQEKGTDVPQSAWDLMPQLNVGWSLGNSLENLTKKDGYVSANQDGTYKIETKLNNPYTTENMIKAVADAGFSSIRIPTSFYNHLSPVDAEGRPTDDATIDPYWLERIKQVVDWAYEYDLYVVLNVHHDTGMWIPTDTQPGMPWIFAEADNLKENIDALNNIWGQYAEAFKYYDHHLIFQSTGEIINKEKSFNAEDYRDFQAARDINQAFITTVRNTGEKNADRFLILETYAANSEPLFVHQNFYKPYEDTASDKLLFGVHNYSTDTEALSNSFKELYKSAAKYNMPFIMDECGANLSNTPDPAKRAAVSKTLAEQAQKYGMAIMIWDDGMGEWAMIDRRSSDAAGTVVYYDTPTVDGITYNVKAKQIRDALFEGKATTKLPEAELTAIAEERFAATDFKGLNSGNMNAVLKCGMYSTTTPEAYYPVSVYLKSDTDAVCIYPYVYAQGSRFKATFPDGYRVTVRELNENGMVLRNVEVNEEIDFYYVPKDDAVFGAINIIKRDAPAEEILAAVRDGSIVLAKPKPPEGKLTILNTVANSAKKTNDVIWDKSKVKGATKYEINWRARGASKWAERTVGNTVRGTTSGLTIKGLYEIRVRPKNSVGNGAWSNTVYRYFHTTVKIRLASKSKGSFTMSWKKNPQATSYQVLYTTNKNGAGAAQNIKTAKARDTSITVKDIKVNGKTQKLKSGTTYYVQIREIRKVGGKNYIGNISCPVAVKIK